MYLKRLDIKGFKSFADSTELGLKPGINVIVGPNGCGKSNVVDAIRWVLGESNIRNLRGQNYEDVIFNGTDKKKPLGLASVYMTIDNCDHSLPVDYSEVTVGRKVYRSGESEFYLNKSRVRLKDIANLFVGTGLGKKGYSIISQGELEQVLNGQGFDRRLILEEASGIIKHRQQRDEVNKRIMATADDLTRVGDLLTELEIRKNELQVKADKANIYQDKMREAAELEKTILQYELDRAGQEWAEKNADLDGKQKALEGLRLEIEAREQELRTEEQEMIKEQARANDFKERQFNLETQLNSWQSDIKLAEEKIKNGEERLQTVAADKIKYNSMLEKLTGDLEVTGRDFQQEKEKYQHRLKEVQVLSQDIKAWETENKRDQDEFENFKNLVFERVNQESILKNEILEKEQALIRVKEKKERLGVHTEEAALKIQAGQQKLKELEDGQTKNGEQLDGAQNQVNQLEMQKSELTAVLQKLEQDYKDLNHKIITLDNQLAAIKNMEKNYTGYSETVRNILSLAQKGEKELPGILGVMGDLLDVPAGMELAIDTAVGKGLENIVIEKGEQARRAIQFLKRRRMGRVTFLPLDLLRVQAVPDKVRQDILPREGVFGLASALVSFEPRYQKAVEYLLGRVLVVANLDNGLKVFENIRYPLRIVTIEGEIINVSGAMSGGSRPTNNASPLRRRNEEKKLLQLLEQNQQEIEQVKLQSNQVTGQLHELQQMLAVGQKNLAEKQVRREIMGKEIQNITRDINSCLEIRDKYVEERAQIEEQLQELAIDIKSRQDSCQAARQENLQLTEELEQCKVNLDLKKRDYEVGKERLTSYNDQLQMKKKELENSEKNIEQFEQVQKSYQDSLQEAEQLEERLCQEITIQSDGISQVNSSIIDIRRELEKVRQEINRARQSEKQHSDRINQIRQALFPGQKQMAELENDLRKLEINIARVETEWEGLKTKWRERFNHQPPAHTGAVWSTRMVRDYRRRLNELNEQLEELGPVDITSIQEYEEVKTRYEFMHNQYLDLSAAKSSLESLLKETENIMAKNFSHFLLRANESFNRTFVDIFGGGEAGLELEAGSRFDAGIDIVVKMPGKKNQPLNLLSGGERALTCIALIFALLRLRPAPFCLLDEIDASLDEVNLIRFAHFLKSMAEEIQFIVITHRQVTIEAGTNIYGVTMPEEGISSVLSLNLAEAEYLAG